MKLKQWAQDWFAAWQASHAGSHRTAQSCQGLLQNTILPCLGRYELAELTPLRLKRFFAGLPGGKAKNTYKLLRTILQQGVTAGLLAENPCTPEILGEEVLARRKAGPHREQPVFTREEREKLPAACKSIVESQIRTLCALQAVDARCNPDHLLFATPDGRPVEANVLREHLALLERRAGVPCLTFSAIRETAIRQAREDGGTAAEVMERFHCKDRQAFLRRYRQK